MHLTGCGGIALYIPAMLYEFSLPTKADKVPAGADWLHEIKYDGYRMMLIREQARVRLISRGGHDWARRFPLIVTAALKLRQEHERGPANDGSSGSTE